MYSCLAVSHTGYLVWLVIESNNFCYFCLGQYKVRAKFRFNLRWQSEWFSVSIIYIWVYTITSTLGNELFVGLYITLLLFWPFIMIVGWMVHVNQFKFTIHLVLGAPPTVLDISSNLVFEFIDAKVLKVGNYLNITFLESLPLLLVWVCVRFTHTPWTVART